MSSSSSPNQSSRPTTLPLIPQQPHWTKPPPSPPSLTPLTTTSFSRSSIGDASIALSSLSISINNQQPIVPLPTPSPGISQITNANTNTNTNPTQNGLSPPTPAPSPSPSPRDKRTFRHSHNNDNDDDDNDNSDEELMDRIWKGKNRQHVISDPQDLIYRFTSLSPSQRFSFLTSLVGELRLNEALVVSRKIEPLLRRDFLRELPAELALHCLSFVDEPKTLARAAQVSHYWNQLLQDEQTWKDLFDRHDFPTPTSFIHRPIGLRSRSATQSFANANTNNPFSVVNGSINVGTNTRTSNSQQSCINRATPFGLERRVLTLASSRLRDKEDGTFKGRFKNAYLTESNWLSGGRILANHVSADDAVVTTLCFDDSHIVVGMANNKIHVFDAITGTFLRSLLGHRQGVWAMVLVSANRAGTGTGTGSAFDVDDDVNDDDASEDSFEDRIDPNSRRFGQNQGHSENFWNGHGRASDSYRDNGQSRRSSFAGGTTTERHPPLGSSSSHHNNNSNGNGNGDHHDYPGFGQNLNSSSPGGIFPQSQINQPARPNTAMGFTPLPNGLLGLGIGNSNSRGDNLPFSASATSINIPALGESASSSTPQDDEEMKNKKMRSSDPCGCARGWKGNRNNLVVSAGCDKEVKVWNLDTGELLHSMRGHTSTIRCLKVLDKRPVAISGSRDHTLRVWDIENGHLLHVLAGHEESVRCVEIAGNMAVSGSYDYTARLWNLDTGECAHVLRGHYHQIYSVAFDGQMVVTGSLDSTIRVWSAATGDCLALLQGHTALVGQLQLSSSRLITGGSDGRVIIFDLSTLTTSHRLCAHDNSVTCLQFDDRFIVSGGNDGRVKLWDVKSGRFVRELTRPCDAVWRVGFRSDRVVLLCQREGRTCLEVISFRPGEGERRARS
ncbi:uncharacterized protein IL334_000274 [Kwoniella shivajii]|uniref:F-box domain-containing protein n=1 Tax=Kwoniella shivajii TaxID=564305 RepID=A0ABZ1CNP6_9TREE|nr:hypothetical protein IL334_000274 [Kwoniella shivajii]